MRERAAWRRVLCHLPAIGLILRCADLDAAPSHKLTSGFAMLL